MPEPPASHVSALALIGPCRTPMPCSPMLRCRRGLPAATTVDPHAQTMAMGIHALRDLFAKGEGLAEPPALACISYSSSLQECARLSYAKWLREGGERCAWRAQYLVWRCLSPE